MMTIVTYTLTLANVVFAVMMLPTCSGFLIYEGDTLSSLCFSRDQYCTCSEDRPDVADHISVRCEAKNLTQFPNFTKISDQLIGHYKDFGIYLSDNELTTMPSGVFWNFNRANKNENSINLELVNNKISIIENAAFVGINNMDVSINLRNNRLTALPLPLKLLNNLTGLYISGNPLLAFDPATINSMANSLLYLGIDYNTLLLGNRELSVLNITEIEIIDIPSDYGNHPFNPFLILRNTNLMYIEESEATTLPCSFIDEPEMKYFYIHDAKNISANRVFDCQSGTSLKVIEFGITNSNIDEFPNVLNLMPSLLVLYLDSNNISSINEKFIPLHNKLKVLHMSNNQLLTIPDFFNRFDNLEYLYIEYSQVTTVVPESYFLSLKSLCAGGNPWWYSGTTNCTYNYPHFF